ncbi:MAG: polysaccharide deacetylase family protein [Candidatus Cloacimonetes bacterium]|nr:polysaccharide deacetylase family protein [Candidatus Cloacimonadota bacterium]
MKNIISIDVEDWFHILELESTPDLKEWNNLESRVENNFLALLDLLDESEVRATCFFLGWIAEKFPRLVSEASKRKHEIAAHGYAHQLVHALTENQFYEDISKTKKILEDISGSEVIGYRAPGFSITPQTTWAFTRLAEAGYKYDSSLFPAKRGHGYFLNTKLHPYKLSDLDFFEFPLTVKSILMKKICFFGGGYLRLFPFWLVKLMSDQVMKENRPVIYYVHPREIDVNQPRLTMNWQRRFKSYINLKTTKPKLTKLIKSYQYTTYRDFISEYQDYFK